jgi:uncharacterized membrane protein YedE/YeeE
MDSQILFTPEMLRNLIPALVAGLLLGVAHSLTKRLGLVACVLGAGWLLLTISVGGVGFSPNDLTQVQNFLTTWKMEGTGVLLGIVIGYTLVKRTETKNT